MHDYGVEEAALTLVIRGNWDIQNRCECEAP